MYSFCCVIPVYEAFPSVHDIILRAREQVRDVLVVDDASGETGFADRYSDSDVQIVHHKKSKGRGACLLTAVDMLQKQGFDYMIVLEPDGRFQPEDLSRFLPYLQDNDYTIAIGNRDFLSPEDAKLPCPAGRFFANAVFRIETGLRIPDTLCTFRAYPLKYIPQLKYISDRMDYETELLTRGAWANLEVRSLRIRYNVMPYTLKELLPLFWQRTFTHLKLFAMRLVPLPKKRLRPGEHYSPMPMSPKNFFSYLMKENATPGELAAAAFVGTYFAVLPLFGFHTPVVLYFASVFRLNRFMAFMIQHPFVLLPVTPFLCIELGYFMRYGKWLTDFDWKTWISEIGLRAWEWLLGSLVLAPVFALSTAVIVYFLTLYFQKRIRLKFRQQYRSEHQKAESGIWALKRKILENLEKIKK